MLTGVFIAFAFAIADGSVDPVASPASAEPAAALAALESEQARLFSRVAPSVVLIVRDGVSGSGFAVAPGLILTNAHVVGEAPEVAVQAQDGRYGRAQVVARATGALDLALVRNPFADLPTLPAGDPDLAKAGTWAATVGHGGGAAWTFSTGLVANPSPLGEGAPILLAQMALRPGSSGGPLVDRLGHALGIVTSGTRDASGVTFAIRVDAAAAAFPQLAGWWRPPVEPSPPMRAEPPPAAEAVAAAPGRTDGVERLASTRALGPSDTSVSLEPAPAMVTVWEAPPPSRRARARVRPEVALAPVASHAEGARHELLPEAPGPHAPPAPLALAAIAALAIAAGAAIALARGR